MKVELSIEINPFGCHVNAISYRWNGNMIWSRNYLFMYDQQTKIEIATLKVAAQASTASKERHDNLLIFQTTQQRLEEKEHELKEAQ